MSKSDLLIGDSALLNELVILTPHRETIGWKNLRFRFFASLRMTKEKYTPSASG